MSEHRSVWLATADVPSFADLDGEVSADVCVVGGGITGLTTALLLQRDGADVVLLEGGRLGRGTTGNTTGKVTSQHTLALQGLVEEHGEERARSYALANQEAIGLVESLAEASGTDCGFTRTSSSVYALPGGDRGSIEAEHELAVRFGLPASLTTELDLPFEVDLALRFDDQARIHPGRYVAALTTMLAAGGARIFERSRALTVRERSDGATVPTAGGEVHAGAVVVATLLPFVDLGGFFAKATPTRAYGIAVRLASEAPRGMHIGEGSPTRSTAPWDDGEGRGLVVVGEDHPTGEDTATPGRWGELERWARQHFDVESIDHRWSAQDYTTVDGIPYVGRSPRTERTFVATGFRKWGLTNGTAAAQLLADLLAGRTSPAHETFDSTRVGDVSAVKSLVEENVKVGARFVGDRIRRLRAGSVEHLEPGDADLVRVDGEAVGAYRDSAGEVHAVSITCTHLGCTLHWNGAERSWDCPCHGSRFDLDGDVLDGPAVTPLERFEVHLDDAPDGG